MATKKMRRCTGSERFGIEPHEAPVAKFTKQPSRKDGLAAMCQPHWSAYVKGLAADRKAKAEPKGAKAKATPATKATAKAKADAAKVAKAEALIAEVDALPGAEHTKRAGEPDVQAALETAGAAVSASGKAD